MNLSVAAVIEGLDTAQKENMGIVDSDQIAQFVEMWRDYDGEASGWISIENLIFLLCELPPPLGKDGGYQEDVNAVPMEIANKQEGSLNSNARYLIN